MAALPKRRISKRRRDTRRGPDKLKAPVLSTCQKCGEKKLPHFRCPNCGHYGKLVTTPGKKVTKVNKESKRDPIGPTKWRLQDVHKKSGKK